MTNQQNVAVIFDLDGTLIDSSRKVNEDAQKALRELGVCVSLDRIVSDENWEATARAHGNDPEDFWRAFNDSREPWETSLSVGKVALYGDSRVILEGLLGNGYNLGMVTRGGASETDAKLDYFALRQYFEIVEITPPRKSDVPTKALEMKKAIEKLREKNPHIDRVYVVGDSENDDIGSVEEVKKMYESTGIKVVSVYLNRNGKALKKLRADSEISNLTQVYDILEMYHE